MGVVFLDALCVSGRKSGQILPRLAVRCESISPIESNQSNQIRPFGHQEPLGEGREGDERAESFPEGGSLSDYRFI